MSCLNFHVVYYPLNIVLHCILVCSLVSTNFLSFCQLASLKSQQIFPFFCKAVGQVICWKIIQKRNKKKGKRHLIPAVSCTSKSNTGVKYKAIMPLIGTFIINASVYISIALTCYCYCYYLLHPQKYCWVIFFIYLFILARRVWKSKDRCGNWYSGHTVPSLAVCEGEADVNELLSCS